MDPVRLVATKWGNRPHWEFDAVRLGEDEHGSWVGLPVGTVISRPGARLVTDQLQVVLVPRDEGFVATYYGEAGQVPCEVYVDMTTVPEWSDGVVTSVDLDLDVILGITGRVWVDDEDEFADHRVRWGYPPEIVTLATRTCAAVVEAITHREPPYDGTHRVWLSRLSALRA